MLKMSTVTKDEIMLKMSTVTKDEIMLIMSTVTKDEIMLLSMGVCIGKPQYYGHQLITSVLKK
jgi:hypothetical protein